MQEYLRRAVFALLLASIGFGSAIGIVIYVIKAINGADLDEGTGALKASFIAGGAFGFVLGIFMLSVDIFARIRAVSKNKFQEKEIWNLEQKRSLHIHANLASFKEIQQLCRQGLLAIPQVRSVAEREIENGIILQATVGASWRSPGEQVTVKVSPQPDNSIELTCTSCSLSPTIVFDYAKNFENVEIWSNILNSIVKEPTS